MFSLVFYVKVLEKKIDVLWSGSVKEQGRGGCGFRCAAI